MELYGRPVRLILRVQDDSFIQNELASAVAYHSRTRMIPNRGEARRRCSHHAFFALLLDSNRD